MPSEIFMKTLNKAHHALIKVSGGRLGSQLQGLPFLEVTTTGRKSGRPHTVILTAPIVEGDSYVVVGSRGGDPVHPAWFLNLRDNPDVLVSLRGKPPVPMTARVASAEERTPLWSKVIAAAPGYDDYQKKITRQIPLVLLTPKQ